jgi:hypothetical protein
MNDAIGYIVGIVLIGGAFGITWMNSRKHAYILLAVVAVSIVLAQIKGLQMLSLLGIVGVLGIMAASRFAREKTIQQWLAQHRFAAVRFDDAPSLFPHVSNDGSATYANYLVAMADMRCIFSTCNHTYQTGNTNGLAVHCAFYFDENTNVSALEKQFLHKKANTPVANWRKSQLGYFNLRDAEVFKPDMGGIAVGWRLPATIKGYEERYRWIKQTVEQ